MESLKQFPSAVIRFVDERRQELCELCGAGVLHAHYHHRRAKGRGGSRRQSTNSAANCLALHPRCHDYVHAYPSLSYENGWLVKGETEPWVVPVLYMTKRVRFSPEGEIVEVLQ